MAQKIIKALLRNKKPLLLITAIAVVVMIFLGSSFSSLVHNKLEMRKLSRQSLALDKQHEALLKTMERLKKQDLTYIEEIARTQYNMVKPGEIQFRFRK